MHFLLFDFWVVLGRSGSQEWNIHLICKNKQEQSLDLITIFYTNKKQYNNSIYYCCDAYNIFGCYEGRANLVGLILDTSIFYIVDWCLALKDYCRLQQFIAQNEVMKVLLILKL
ncbi:uncharacterized protein OCT59_025528 [Rhizophagus irregularis]|uniref:Uncharacterized protein n=1 Tax=Rhizophagus irregularis TaxID=588596 RepID=A0A915ZJ29_9GLOM|nr:hypothetical protein OCT59_025528 [Rhizophagus irregularis]GBC11359.1 hypothetical protein RIR_jg34223.t1 [Rhizophagus irregularis DAOM 181602=DAOM 197198]CAB4464324.1 unnamed protein product [Rhizophagus irregularis]CAB5379166.1 unnamed protein product [Rhizophagus irregularis]